MSESLNLKEAYAESVEFQRVMDYQLHLYFCEDSTGCITPIVATSPIEAYSKAVMAGLVKSTEVTVNDSRHVKLCYFDFMTFPNFKKLTKGAVNE